MNIELENLIIETIEDEGGVYIDENQKIVDTELDSFGVTMLLVTINEEFKFFEEFKELDFESLTFSDIERLTNVYK